MVIAADYNTATAASAQLIERMRQTATWQTGTIVAVVFAYIVRFLSVSFNAIEAGLGKVTKNMDSAARTLGHGPAETLRKVQESIDRISSLNDSVYWKPQLLSATADDSVDELGQELNSLNDLAKPFCPRAVF